MPDYGTMIWDSVGMFLFLAAELSLLFLLISYGVGVLQQYIPEAKVQALLGGRGGRGYFIAAALGAITPFCSCSTIPMLRGLLKAKAGFGPTLTFLFTSPLLNPIIVGMFFVTFGARVTGIYAAIALGISVVAGFILARMGFERYVIPERADAVATSCCGSSTPASPARSSCCTSAAPSAPPSAACCSPAYSPAGEEALGEEDFAVAGMSAFAPASLPATEAASAAGGCCGAPPPVEAKAPFKARSKVAWREARRQFKDVFWYLLVGVALGAAVYGFVPSDFIARHASGDSLWAVPVAAVIGIPLYVRMEALIPLTAVLAAKGMGLGAIMALLIGGSGASLTEVILLKSMFRAPMVAAFLVVILGMAVSAGFLFQFTL